MLSIVDDIFRHRMLPFRSRTLPCGIAIIFISITIATVYFEQHFAPFSQEQLMVFRFPLECCLSCNIIILLVILTPL